MSKWRRDFLAHKKDNIWLSPHPLATYMILADRIKKMIMRHAFHKNFVKSLEGLSSSIFSLNKCQMKKTIIQNFNYSRPFPNTTEAIKLPVFTLEQEERPTPWCLHLKNVIFVVDVSVSMLESMPNLKASIKTFRDLICGRTSAKQPPVTDDSFSLALPNFHLITFSDEAKLCWSNGNSNTTTSFNELIDSLEVGECSTNMGAGIELAYSLCPPNGSETIQGPNAQASWIVVLTDGESNRGKYQTPDAFFQLASQKPPNTKIVSLGFGENFNADILDNIGEFTYLESNESIPSFMGAFVDEVLSCGIINTGIVFPQRSNQGDDTDIIIGSRDVGWLSNGRQYYFGFVPVLTSKAVTVRFTEIVPEGIFHYSIEERVDNVLPSQELTPEVRSAIACAEAASFVKEIYRCETCKELQRKTKQILGLVEKWTKPGMEEAREMVKRICQAALSSKNGDHTPASLQLANGLQNQTSYIVPVFQTPSALTSSRAAVGLAEAYLE